MIYVVIISRPGINSPANTVETCQTHAKHTAEFHCGEGPLLFATASFPCRGSLIIRLPAEQGAETSEGERDEWKNKKEQRVGWEFFSQPLHHAVKNTPRRPPWGCS